MTTFYNFTLKIETSWAKKIAEPILETWNANDVISYVWFVYSRVKKLKICNIKKNNSIFTKFTTKTKILQIESRLRLLRSSTLVLSM